MSPQPTEWRTRPGTTRRSLVVTEQNGGEVAQFEIGARLVARTNSDRDQLVDVPMNRVVAWSVEECPGGMVDIELHTRTESFRMRFSRGCAASVQQALTSAYGPALRRRGPVVTAEAS